MGEKTRKIAVITGDIVGSTALGPAKLERAMAALAASAKVQAGWHGESLRFTRNRGDGWQVVLARPEMALRSALAFRAALRAQGSEFDSYFGIAKGDASLALNNDLNAETGNVFKHSGDNLEGLKEIRNLDVRMGYVGDGEINAVIALADHLSQGWTPPQAAALLPLLNPDAAVTQTQVAKKLGKSRQAVAKSLEAAHYRPLSRALNSMETGLKTDA